MLSEYLTDCFCLYSEQDDVMGVNYAFVNFSHLKLNFNSWESKLFLKAEIESIFGSKLMLLKLHIVIEI